MKDTNTLDTIDKDCDRCTALNKKIRKIKGYEDSLKRWADEGREDDLRRTIENTKEDLEKAIIERDRLEQLGCGPLASPFPLLLLRK